MAKRSLNLNRRAVFGYFAFVLGFLLALPPILPLTAHGSEGDHDKECVILLHGMGRSKSSMEEVEAFLLDKGYQVVNFDYPSTTESIERLANIHIPKAISQCRETAAGKIHFVTHSLGGIVARQYLQANALPKGSRMVMMAPPNHGSELVDYFKGFFFYKWIYGPAGQELGTDPESLPNRLQPIEIEVGIIAGNKSINPVFSPFIPGTDDGRVSVERTKLTEMDDFVVVPSSHSFIVTNPLALRQVTHFLKHGQFDHSEEAVDGGP